MGKKRVEGRKLRTTPRAVRHGNDQAHRNARSLGEGPAFELASPQLRLQVHDRSFDLDLNRLVRSSEQDVRGPSVPGADRRLKAGVPGVVQRRQDCVGRCQLTRVTKRNTFYRIELEAELMTHGGGHATASQQGDAWVATLSLTDDLLAHAGAVCQLSLR